MSGPKTPRNAREKIRRTIRWAHSGLFYVLVMAQLRPGYVSTYQHDSPRRPRELARRRLRAKAAPAASRFGSLPAR